MSESARVRVVFDAQVQKGQLVFREPARWCGCLGRYEGKRVSVSLDRYRQTRSLPQNKYLWGVVYRAGEEWSGHDADEFHEFFKEKFNVPRSERVLPTGEVMYGRRTTTTMDVQAFSEFVSKVIRWFAEQGVYVPGPDEYEQSNEVWT